MKRKVIWAATLLLVLNSLNAQTNTNGKFVNNIKADTDTSDWRTVPLQYDKKNSVHYAIANDLQYVHVLIIVNDPALKIKLLRAGMEVWLNWKGKNKTGKATGIKYPLKSEEGFNPQERQQNPQQGAAIFKTVLAQKTQLELTGFKKELNGKLNTANNSGVKIAINFTEKNVMIYELSVPFTSLEEAVSFNTTASVGIVFKAIELSDLPNGGRRPGGFGGRPGAGSGGSQQRPDMEKIFKEITIWDKFSLAEK
jgi:hypothetical protein